MNLILYKIKHKWFNSVLYILMLAILTIYMTRTSEFSSPYFILFWFILVTEPYRYSLFDLSGHYGRSIEFNAFKMNSSKLSQNLKLLSIKPLDFSKTNTIYAVFKLVPLWVVIYFTNSSLISTPLFVFTLAMLLKAFIGPLHSIVTSKFRDIFIQYPEMKNKDKKNLFYDTITDLNPFINPKTFRRIYGLFNWGLIGIVAWFYIVVFRDTFIDGGINIYHPIWIVILTISITILTIYSTYLYRLERRLENELYQS